MHAKPGIPRPLLAVLLGLIGLGFLFLPGLAPPAEIPVIALLLGRAHPLVLHFPIVLIMLALVFELFCRFKVVERSETFIRVILILSLLSFVAAIASGYFLFASGEYSGRLMTSHFWGAAISGAAAFLTAGIYFFLPKNSGLFSLYLSGLFVSNVAIVYTGHLGGSLTHGRDFLSEYTPLLFQKPESSGPKDASEMLVYTDLIAPVLEAKCISCHNSQRAKGGLAMDSYASLFSPGESGQPSVTAGDPEKSESLKRIYLPADHPDHMPPEGKSPLSQDEIRLLRYWVQTGASDSLRLTEASKTDSIALAIENMRPVLARYQHKAEAASLNQKIIRAELESLAEKLQVIIEPDSLGEANEYSLSMKFPPAPFTNDQIQSLKPYFPYFSKLSLVSSGIDDDGLYYLGKMENLRELYLLKTGLDGSGLVHLQHLKKLEILNLSYTKTDDQSAFDLMKIPNLKTVYLYRTNVSRQVMEAIMKYKRGLILLEEEGVF